MTTPSSQDVRARALEALRLRREGLKLREIGEKLGGVTRERARQLVLKGQRYESGGKTPVKSSTRKNGKS
jgi:hypothetical protein